MGHSRPLFLYFHLLNTFDSKLMFNINFANDWIRTPVLLHWKRPLYQQPHPLPNELGQFILPPWIISISSFVRCSTSNWRFIDTSSRDVSVQDKSTSVTLAKKIFFLNGHSQPLYVYFPLFNTNITTFTTNKCEKCTSSIRCWDSNPRPSEHKSPPITTRPGLPPNTCHKGQLGTRLFGSNVLVM